MIVTESVLYFSGKCLCIISWNRKENVTSTWHINSKNRKV